MQIAELLEVSAQVDATREQIHVEEMTWRNEEGDLQLFRRSPGSEGAGKLVGKLSSRALGNLSKFSRAGPALLSAQAENTLNALLRTQLSSRKVFSVLHDPTQPEVVIALWPEALGYVSYTDLFRGLENNVAALRGDPVHSDTVTALLHATDLEVAGEKWVVGPFFTLASNQVVKSRFLFGGFRVRCTNGLVDALWANNSLHGVDNSVVNAIARDYVGRMDGYRQHLQGVVEFARQTALDRGTHLEVLSGVPGPLMERLNRVLDEPAVHVKELMDAGVDGSPKTVLDAYSLLTHCAKAIEMPVQRGRVEEKAWSWVNRLKKMFGTN